MGKVKIMGMKIRKDDKRIDKLEPFKEKTRRFEPKGKRERWRTKRRK